jgi:hypothetical protein
MARRCWNTQEITAQIDRFETSQCSRFASSLQELSALRSIRISGVRGTVACGQPCDAVVLIRIQTWTLQAKAVPP